MNKLVYLEELDSVRNTEKEIQIAQRALYEEIVINGNNVAISFNQVLDSRAFLCAIENKEQNEHIITLFEKGKLRFSSYMDPTKTGPEAVINSASQYIQNSINDALGKQQTETYIFSGLPIEHSNQELLTLVYNAIKFSNPAILEQYSNYNNEQVLLEYLQRYVKTVLALSVEKLANNPIKNGKKSNLEDYLNKIMKIPLTEYFISNPDFQTLLKEAFSCLDNIKCRLNNSNASLKKRSNWHTLLKEMTSEDSYLAEAIINIAYNYAVEDSIEGVSKHYNDSDSDIDDFYRDFEFRLNKFWKEYKEDIHVLHAPEKTTHELYENWNNLPHWATATRIVTNPLPTTNDNEITEYENNYELEKIRWSFRTVGVLCTQFLFAIIISFVIHGFNEISSNVESFVGNQLLDFGFSGDQLTIFISNFLIYTIGFGTIWSILQFALKLPDIAENLRMLCLSIFDSVIVLFTPRKIAYRRPKENK